MINKTVSGAEALQHLSPLLQRLADCPVPRAAAGIVIQQAALELLKTIVEGLNPALLDAASQDVRSEVHRRILALVSECEDFGRATVLVVNAPSRSEDITRAVWGMLQAG